MPFIFQEDRSIHTDIRLDNTGDLGVTPGGDLDLIGNVIPMQNVWQATVLRLTTILGTYLFQEGYGTRLRQFVDQPMTDLMKRQITAEINNTILLDPRVKQLVNLSIQQVSNPDGYQISLSFMTVSNQQVGGIITVTGD